MICDEETTAVDNPVGTEGGVVSVVAVRVTCAVEEPKLFVAVS